MRAWITEKLRHIRRNQDHFDNLLASGEIVNCLAALCAKQSQANCPLRFQDLIDCMMGKASRKTWKHVLRGLTELCAANDPECIALFKKLAPCLGLDFEAMKAETEGNCDEVEKFITLVEVDGVCVPVLRRHRGRSAGGAGAGNVNLDITKKVSIDSALPSDFQEVVCWDFDNPCVTPVNLLFGMTRAVNAEGTFQDGPLNDGIYMIQGFLDGAPSGGSTVFTGQEGSVGIPGPQFGFVPPGPHTFCIGVGQLSGTQPWRIGGFSAGTDTRTF